MLSAEQNFDPADRLRATGGHGFVAFAGKRLPSGELAEPVPTVPFLSSSSQGSPVYSGLTSGCVPTTGAEAQFNSEVKIEV